MLDLPVALRCVWPNPLMSLTRSDDGPDEVLRPIVHSVVSHDLDSPRDAVGGELAVATLPSTSASV